MRSAQKQEVLGLIESLHQAHEEIKEALLRKRMAVAQNMIAECQEFAVSLGENIERLEKVDDDNLPTWREMRGILNGNS